MTITVISANRSSTPSFWTRLTEAPLRWARPRRPSETAAPNAKPNAEAGGVVGAKTSAVFVDRSGHLRVIELYLPTDVLADMRQPIELRFLEGEEGIRSDQMKHGISTNFQGFQ